MQLEDLSDEFDWVVRKFSEKTPYKVTKFLGSGEHGDAYLTEDDKVVKITTDKSEYDESRKLLNKDPLHLPTIYDCFTVDSKRLSRPIWIIVLEHVRHNKKEQNYFYFKLKKAFKKDLNLDLLGELSSFQVDNTDIDVMDYYSKKLNVGDDIKNYYHQLLEMIDEMKKYGVKSIDYGPHNFGFRGDTLVFFDLGFGEEDGGGTHKTFKI